MQQFHVEMFTNKVNIRYFKILNELERKRSVSGANLSRATGATTRTLISDIAFLREYFGDSITITVTNCGYIFNEKNIGNYKKLKRELMADEPLFIIIRAIFKGELLTVGEWADKLYLSESSVIRFLKKLQKLVKTYNFKLGYQPVDFHGEECNIRKFFLLFFYEADIIPHTITPSLNIQNLICDFLKIYHEQLHLTLEFTKSAYILMIILERNKNGHVIKIPQLLKNKLKKFVDFSYLESFDKMLKSKSEITLPEDELFYIIFLALTNRQIEMSEFEKGIVENYSNEWIDKLTNEYCLKQKSLLTENFQFFVRSFFTTCYLQSMFSEIYIKNIPDINLYAIEHYTEQYQLNYRIIQNSDFRREIFSDEIVEDLTVNLTLYLNAVENTYVDDSKKIVFILEGNHHLCLNLKAAAKKYLGKNHQLYFLDYGYLNKEFLDNNEIDLVVTNYAEYITDCVLSIDYILTKAIPTTDDWNTVLEKVNPKINKVFSLVGRKCAMG